MSGGVWAYSENEAVAGEVASAAAQVAAAMNSDFRVVELGHLRDGVKGGAKLLIKGPLGPDLTPGESAEALARAARISSPKVILVGATRNGREVASRVAAKLKAGCISEAFRLSIEGGELVGERNVYAGKVLARLSSKFPVVATVKVGSYPRGDQVSSEVQELDVGEVKPSVKVLGRKGKEAGAVDLKTAKVIVSAGRGVKKKEDLPMLEALAKEMGGALGCSRPLSSDLGWLPEEHHIGLTGVSVKPDLYLAVGISGQLQHVAGMKDSKVVAAVNTDRDAPIFQAADYGIVGDLYLVVPALRKLLAARS